MRPDLRSHATADVGLLARWQHLTREDPYGEAYDHATRDLRAVFPGVHVTGFGPITQDQIWRAATLTAPDTALHVASAAALFGVRSSPGPIVTVVRPGTRGVRHSHGLRVAYSASLEGNLTTVRGIPTTTLERTLIDLWLALPPRQRSKLLRESLRLEQTTPIALLAAIHANRRRRGTAALRAELQQRMHLPFHRCKSDAEAFGLVVLDDAGVDIPEVNERVAGEEADFWWPALGRIIEIDGPQWHRFKEEDARKTAIWRAAGLQVDRIPSDLVFDAPRELLRLAPPPRPRTPRPTPHPTR